MILTSNSEGCAITWHMALSRGLAITAYGRPWRKLVLNMWTEKLDVKDINVCYIHMSVWSLTAHGIIDLRKTKVPSAVKWRELVFFFFLMDLFCMHSHVWSLKLQLLLGGTIAGSLFSMQLASYIETGHNILDSLALFVRLGWNCTAHSEVVVGNHVQKHACWFPYYYYYFKGTKIPLMLFTLTDCPCDWIKYSSTVIVSVH